MCCCSLKWQCHAQAWFADCVPCQVACKPIGCEGAKNVEMRFHACARTCVRCQHTRDILGGAPVAADAPACVSSLVARLLFNGFNLHHMSPVLGTEHVLDSSQALLQCKACTRTQADIGHFERLLAAAVILAQLHLGLDHWQVCFYVLLRAPSWATGAVNVKPERACNMPHMHGDKHFPAQAISKRSRVA